ncbi:MAG TPA: DUF5666 domain-containing protein, partial [Thermoanaerobaculia bacterium]|nr:DUF5666 domain-containing protein [Thermoanaerobaculia bacterium]
RDLERGDRVAVDLVSARGALRARSVRVLESVSHRGGYGLDGRRGTLLEGRIVGIDARRDRLVVRGDRGRPITVDGRRLDRSHGRAWARGLRVGEPVRIHGSFNRRGVFVAEWLGADRRHDGGRGRRR